MAVALAMVVRDEVDVVDQHLRFHLAAGVDVVLATDHGSLDGTREILERYAREGAVRVFDGDGPYNRQGEWMTRMARIAATELGVDWVLCSDGDEFWWPASGSIRDVLRALPERYGTAHVLSQSFPPLPDDGRPFHERMIVRYSPGAPVHDPATPYRPVAKVVHRAHPDAAVSNGNHEVRGVPGAVLRGWLPLEILHFPLRSAEQVARKYRKTLQAWAFNPRGDLARARSLAEEDRSDAMYRRIVVEPATLERGLAVGALVRDTRLRDALQGPGRAASRGARNPRHPFEVAVLAEAEVVRLQRHVESLEVAVGGLARAPRGARAGAIRLRRP